MKADKTDEVLAKNNIVHSSNDLPQKFFDKPKEEKAKKFSESRRERRASMRNQPAKDKEGEPVDGTDLVEKLQVRKEQSQEGRKSGRDRKHLSSEQNKEDRRSSLESNGGADARPDTAGSRVDRDAARIRKKVFFWQLIVTSMHFLHLFSLNVKDRPSLQIYQPGRRRNSDNPENNSPIDKALIKPSESDFVLRDSKPDASNELTTPKTSAVPEKRISRYSERRNKNKEQQRKQQSSGTDSVSTLNDGMAKLELDPEQ